MSVLIFVETDEGALKKSAFEAVNYGAKVAQQLGTSATALALGAVNGGELEKLGNYGAAKVLHAADEKLNEPVIQAYASAIAQAAEQEGSQVVIFSKSSLSDGVASRVAARLQAGMAANVISLPETSGGFVVKRSIFTGKAFANSEITTEKKVLSLKKNTFAIEETGGSAAVEAFSPSLSDADFAVRVKGVEKATGDVLLPEAERVVSGGRGLKGPENWNLVEDLAKALGAATACSKPVSDADWRPHHEHVGQTGIKISPNLYIAIGISGAIQHLAGVNSSKVIVVINKDPEAPFFKAADYGIVGDAFEVVPKITEAVKALD
ncbi:electron transfer flavoprotein alpha subunit [Catalinimonas alkaloidigena]|uniref:Electron transfer flavoprotein alpha subunit n=1 Tax=Catalinimonas alkaloidigena TaxID=1075417 RepID=A0A1G9RIM6_9BACT|nr:electron transfer flavoprotein subunit alpha/FixB family protein [Catalinimonas alkaloidigena]SDM22717.1 electron transfer flavoprotein alpha subunit [Catalinimonas alkaloidigena]